MTPAVSVAVSDKRRSIDFQGREYNPGYSRRSTCPIPGCDTLTRKLKHHAYKKKPSRHYAGHTPMKGVRKTRGFSI